MKVRILRTCRADNQHLEAGKVYELPEKPAKELLSLRKAERLDPVIETRDPMIRIGDEASEPFSKRGKK